MPLYMYQAAYVADSWAAQLKKPQNRADTVGRAACEAVGGKLVGSWYCFGDYDLIIIVDVPDNESMSAIALAIAAGGAVKSAKTTVLMSAVAGMKKRARSKVRSPPDSRSSGRVIRGGGWVVANHCHHPAPSVPRRPDACVERWRAINCNGWVAAIMDPTWMLRASRLRWCRF
jgi:uncharacterized protein with GYD domain